MGDLDSQLVEAVDNSRLIEAGFEWLDDIYNYDGVDGSGETARGHSHSGKDASLLGRTHSKDKSVIIEAHQGRFKTIDYELLVNFQQDFPTALVYSPDSIHLYSLTPGDLFCQNILDSYQSDGSLEEQFVLDVSRSIMYLNQHQVKSPRQAIAYLEHTYSERSRSIMALCTQAVYATPFEWIYYALPHGFHLCELDSLDSRFNERKVKIILEDGRLSIWKMLRIIRLVDQEKRKEQDGLDDIEPFREVCLAVTVDLHSWGAQGEKGWWGKVDDVAIEVWFSEPKFLKMLS